MGCCICSDSFHDPDGEARPACLPCGHIFHSNCIARWFRSQKGSPTCPHCRSPAKDSDIKVLRPEEKEDLDELLSKLKDGESLTNWPGELVGLDKDDAKELLSNMDNFAHHLKNYVMSVLYVRVETARKNQEKVLGLAKWAIKDEEGRPGVDTAAEHLLGVLNLFRSRLDRLDLRDKDLKRRMREVKAALSQLETKMTEVDRRDAQLTSREKTIESRASEAHRIKTEVIIEQQLWEKRKLDMQAEVLRAQDEVRLTQQMAQQVRVEAQMYVTQKDLETNRKISEMEQRVQEAEGLQFEAEEERERHKVKSNTLADQMRGLQKQLKESQQKRRQDRESSFAEMAELRERLAKAEATAAAAVASSSRIGKSPTTASGSKASASQRPSSSSLAPTPSPTTSRIRPSSSLASLDPDESSQSLIVASPVSAKPRKPVNSSITGSSSQSARSTTAAEEADDDDLFFNLPGFPASKYKRIKTDPSIVTSSSSNEHRPPLTTSRSNSHGSVGGLSNGVDDRKKIKSESLMNTLSRPYGVATGRKQKVKRGY